MSFVSCEGNNDRFRWEMTSVDLMCTPGAEPQVTLAFSTDGVEWYRVGLDDGPRRQPAPHHRPKRRRVLPVALGRDLVPLRRTAGAPHSGDCGRLPPQKGCGTGEA